MRVGFLFRIFVGVGNQSFGIYFLMILHRVNPT